MPHTRSFPSVPQSVLPLALDTGWSSRGPDFGFLEAGMGRAFDAIRTVARIAWWDGSAVGLRLHGFIGLFDLDETGSRPRVEDER